MRNAVVVALLACLTLTIPTLPRAAAVPPNDLALLFERTTDTVQYVNGSTIEAWAELTFPGTPDPPPQLAPIEFRWYAPNGSLESTATANADASYWALGTYRVTTLGRWSVNATYLGTPALWRNRTFMALPAAWSGVVYLSGSTAVGGNATLDIAAGTLVRLDSGVNLRVKGNLLAGGTSILPVSFTANSSTPTPGYWGSIEFLPPSGAASQLDNVTIDSATEGIRLVRAAPRITDVDVSICARVAFHVVAAQTRLARVRAATAPYGVIIENGTVSVENATLRDLSYGILAFGGSVTVRNATVANATQSGIDARGSIVDVSNATLGAGGGVGLRLAATVTRANRLAFGTLREGVLAENGTKATLGNSSFSNTTARHIKLVGDASVAVINGTFPPSGERVNVTAGSKLTFWNYLRVIALDYDSNNTTLGGVAVDVYTDDARFLTAATDGNGTTPALLLPYRRYDPFPSEPAIRVVVILAGFAFAFNNRTVAVNVSTIARFQGSVHDLNGNGDPDFSDTDIDGDGLLNWVEQGLGTNPRNTDTDGDGMPDGWEFGFSPATNLKDQSDRDADPDQDGLTNYDEYRNGTDPRTPDTDEDGMPDGWEVRYRLNPTNASDANQDVDGDGFTNLREYKMGTNPQDQASFPRGDSLAGVWPFLVGVLAAIVILVLSRSLRRPAPRRKDKPAPPEEQRGPRLGGPGA